MLQFSADPSVEIYTLNRIVNILSRAVLFKAAGVSKEAPEFADLRAIN